MNDNRVRQSGRCIDHARVRGTGQRPRTAVMWSWETGQPSELVRLRTETTRAPGPVVGWGPANGGVAR